MSNTHERRENWAASAKGKFLFDLSTDRHKRHSPKSVSPTQSKLKLSHFILVSKHEIVRQKRDSLRHRYWFRHNQHILPLWTTPLVLAQFNGDAGLVVVVVRVEEKHTFTFVRLVWAFPRYNGEILSAPRSGWLRLYWWWHVPSSTSVPVAELHHHQLAAFGE